MVLHFRVMSRGGEEVACGFSSASYSIPKGSHQGLFMQVMAEPGLPLFLESPLGALPSGLAAALSHLCSQGTKKQDTRLPVDPTTRWLPRISSLLPWPHTALLSQPVFRSEVSAPFSWIQCSHPFLSIVRNTDADPVRRKKTRTWCWRIAWLGKCSPYK